MVFYIKHLIHYADMLAIPCFLLLFIYFYEMEDKTPLEYLFLFGSLCGVIIDSVFTYMFLMKE